MTDLLTRRPDRPLPPGQHEKRRADLLAAIETEESRTPRRPWVPLTAAAAVFTVVAGLAVGVQVLKHDDAVTPAGSAHPQPATRELSTAETKALRAQCEAEANRITANGIKHPFQDYKTVRAFEITGVKDPKIVTTWLMGSGEQVYNKGPKNIKPRSEPAYWFCSRTAGGVISESSVRFGTKAMLLGGPVFGFARNGGVYTAPVVRVTVQPKGKPEVEAVLQDGFWFAPTEGRTKWGPYDADDPARKDYVVRGYDANDRQVYATTDPPDTRECTLPYTKTSRDGTTTTVTPTVAPVCKYFTWPS
ncbi:hypothetical protein ACXC9Q_23255 (plasmid) [Kribbella sp. CWNU-51]